MDAQKEFCPLSENYRRNNLKIWNYNGKAEKFYFFPDILNNDIPIKEAVELFPVSWLRIM